MKKFRLFNIALLWVCVLCVQDSLAQNDNPLSLPEGVIARLGKGELSWEDRAVAYSFDGTRLAVASHIGIWIYDAHTGTEVALLTGQGSVYSVAFSPDGSTLASTHIDEDIWLWDVDTGQQKAVLEPIRKLIFC